MVDDNEKVADDTATGKTSVFLAWSGTVSQKMAVLLKKYLPLFVRSIDIFISDDITKGKRWHTEIANALGSTKFGILCLTPENLTSEWIHFEAGALSKTIDDATHVCPLLLDVKKSDLKEPLASFHATFFDEKEFKELVNDLAQACGDSLEGEQLTTLMEALWPKINDNITELKAELVEARKESGEPDDTEPKANPLLEEVVVRVREQGRLLATLIEEGGIDRSTELFEAIYNVKRMQRDTLDMLKKNYQPTLFSDRVEDYSRRNELRYSDMRKIKQLNEILQELAPEFLIHNDAEALFDYLIKNGRMCSHYIDELGGRTGTIEHIRNWRNSYILHSGEEQA